MISWRNPDARHARWDLDAYGQAVLDALDAVSRITHSDQAALTGVCSGGIISAMVVAHLAQTGQQDRIAAFTLLASVLDQERAGLASAVIDERRAQAAIAASQARGYLDGRSLAEVFAWLRPNDLIWNYWVNNYLLGRPPPPFDILFWNADTTRMTAGLHRDFLQLAVANALAKPAARPCSARRWTCRWLIAIPISSPGSPTTSAPGRAAIAPPRCSAEAPDSCCRPAGTSPRW
jgi:polyhydroxyalkanoate synthase